MIKTLFQLKFIFQDHHTEEAYNYYRLALSKSLTRGRRAEQIYASCVYLSCRTGSTDTEHMLLGMVLICPREKKPMSIKIKTIKDFSEVLKINVFVLGKTFIQLTRALNITLPLLDPAFYIYRFAHKLGKWIDCMLRFGCAIVVLCDFYKPFRIREPVKRRYRHCQ